MIGFSLIFIHPQITIQYAGEYRTRNATTGGEGLLISHARTSDIWNEIKLSTTNSPTIGLIE